MPSTELKLLTGDVSVECTSCHSSRMINAEAVEAAMTEAIALLRSTEAAAASPSSCSTLRDAISQLTSLGLAPTTHPVLALRQSLLAQLISLQDFGRSTAELALSVLHSHQAVLPPNYPATGIAAAVVVRLRGAGEDGERNWQTRQGLEETGRLARVALEVRGVEGKVRKEMEEVMSAVQEGSGRLEMRGS